MREIPSIEQLRQRPTMRALEAEFGRTALVEALRAQADTLRRRAAGGEPAPDDVAAWLDHSVPARLVAAAAPSLQPVINATGVILHTNLGRAPLARAAVERVAALSGYTNLEYDLDHGAGVGATARGEAAGRLTGAEAAVSSTTTRGHGAHARGACGGARSDRVEGRAGRDWRRIPDPDVSGSRERFREVGTTNRTVPQTMRRRSPIHRGAAARAPIQLPDRGLHRGPALGDPSRARPFDLPVIEDIGSGWIGADPKPAAPRRGAHAGRQPRGRAANRPLQR